jgi:hypothetical protein
VRLAAGQWLRLTIAALVGGALVVVSAKAVGRWIYDPTIWPLAGWYVPPDFGDFYAAAEAVVRGGNPYQADLSREWLSFVYPPLLA